MNLQGRWIKGQYAKSIVFLHRKPLEMKILNKIINEIENKKKVLNNTFTIA